MSEPVLKIDIADRIATLTLNRLDKRNAMSEALLEALDGFFAAPPEGVKAAIIVGSGGHYCAGLDLSEHVERSAEDNMHHSRAWHAHLPNEEGPSLMTRDGPFSCFVGSCFF